MKTTLRIAIICTLLVVTAGLCVQYDRADLWTYPTTEELAADPGTYDGQRVFLFGDVESVDHANSELLITTGSDPEIELTVENVPPKLSAVIERGGAVQVYGTLTDASSVVVADEVVADYRHTGDQTYVHLTSVLGGLLVAGVFLWYWRPVVRRLQFSARGDR